MWLPLAVGVTAYFALLLAVRFKWGYERAKIPVAIITSLVFYVGIVLCVGMWEEMWLSLATGLTAYLAALLAVRIKWGYEKAKQSLARIMSLAFACLVGMSIFIAEYGLVNLAYAVGGSVLSFCYGYFFGMVCFLLVRAVVSAVDWLDNLMETKPPQDE